jgi:RHS repeat-associated protein
MRERFIEVLPGQYFDRETSLSYNYFRDYDSSIGRYVENDPIGVAGLLRNQGMLWGNVVVVSRYPKQRRGLRRLWKNLLGSLALRQLLR